MFCLSLLPGIAGSVLVNLTRREPQRKRARLKAGQVLRKMWLLPAASSASK